MTQDERWIARYDEVIMMDYLKAFPEAAHVYQDADEETKFMVRMYSESFRNRSN